MHRPRPIRTRPAAVTLVVLLGSLAGIAGAASPDYLQVVRNYADAMIEHGRDRYGETHSPLFACTLNRQSLELLQGEAPSIQGVRPQDRAIGAANPMHDQNLYQVLYALSAATGEPRYAAAADGSLRWFFEHCQSETTGLLAWGEHLGWRFDDQGVTNNGRAADLHEFFRPWVLWDRSYALAPQPCHRFARGLWDHQIHDQHTGAFSRHAGYSRHKTRGIDEYPRHGGFYIAAWAAAYAQTRDPVMLEAIETLVDFFDRRRSSQSDAIPAESNVRSGGKMLWPASNLSLAIDLETAAAHVPDTLSAKLRQSAARTDAVFLRLAHDLSPPGPGFVRQAHVDTLAPEDVRRTGKLVYSERWATGYGRATDAKFANLCSLRYLQTGDDGYRKLVLAAADRYLESEPDPRITLYPGTMGHVILNLLAAYDTSGESHYLARADHFAQQAVATFLPSGSPLPRASSKHEHYEAMTRADTLMMALLKLWEVQSKHPSPLPLVFSDR